MAAQTHPRSPVGLVMATSTAPENIPSHATAVEEMGFGELWMPEDYFFNAAPASAVAALAATRTLPVGVGVMSAVARHPAVTAMEIATMARMHPGRVRACIGLGAPVWVDQMGLRPVSQIAAVRESVAAVRSLLAGERVTSEGRVHSLYDVALEHPPEDPPPIYMGGIGPNMLRLSGQVADAHVVSVLSDTKYVRWLREQIAKSRAEAGRSDPHRVVTFALCGFEARSWMRGVLAFYLSIMPRNAMTSLYGIADELDELARLGDGAAERIEDAMREEWLDDLCIAGTPAQATEKIQALREAGSDTVALSLVAPNGQRPMLELIARAVLPEVHDR